MSVPPGVVSQPLPGVMTWKNPKNGFFVFELHYTADPAKRDPSYIASIKGAMPIQQFNMEYEKNWASFVGMPVYADFAESRHCMQEAPEPINGLPMMRGWDFGLTPACVIAQMQGSQLIIMREFTASNMGAKQFAALILPQIAQLYPAWWSPGKHWFDFVDPAGFNRDQSDEGQCTQELADCGLQPIAGPIAYEARKGAVEQFLIKRSREGEALQIWAPDCRMLVEGFKGGYHYPEKSKEVEPMKLRPVKNMYSHPHDALQYIASCVLQGGLRGNTVSIPTASYFTPRAR